MKKLILVLLTLISMTSMTISANAAAKAISGVVNVNTATMDQLQLIPGIGLAKASAIVEERKAKPFDNVQDLLEVKGIGDKLLSQITPYVTTKGESTLHEADVKNKVQ